LAKVSRVTWLAAPNAVSVFAQRPVEREVAFDPVVDLHALHRRGEARLRLQLFEVGL
jgi:hypothetical protein